MGPRLRQDALWPCNDLQLRWCRSLREMGLERRTWRGGKVSRTKHDPWRNFQVHTDVSRCTELHLRAERSHFPKAGVHQIEKSWIDGTSQGFAATAFEASHWKLCFQPCLPALILISTPFRSFLLSGGYFTNWDMSKGHCLRWSMRLVDAAVAFIELVSKCVRLKFNLNQSG